MRLSGFIIALSIITLIVIAPVFVLHATMMKDNRGNMRACPLMEGAASVCRMDAMGHITKWQSTFAAAVPAIVVLLLVLVLAVFGCRLAFIEDDGYRKNPHSYERQSSLLVVFNCFRTALSDGILHPKIYNSSFSVG